MKTKAKYSFEDRGTDRQTESIGMYSERTFEWYMSRPLKRKIYGDEENN